MNGMRRRPPPGWRIWATNDMVRWSGVIDAGEKRIWLANWYLGMKTTSLCCCPWISFSSNFLRRRHFRFFEKEKHVKMVERDERGGGSFREASSRTFEIEVKSALQNSRSATFYTS